MIWESSGPWGHNLLGAALADYLPASQGVGEEMSPCHHLCILSVHPGPSPGGLHWSFPSCPSSWGKVRAGNFRVVGLWAF